ncbi:MAG: glycosyltransferase family 1 protein [Lysobacter sp.]|nr:glycosyltransferase family 1 protein [Lysobacter sp.]
MRYAIVSETYPPDVNGVALTVQSLERGLIERGHDTTVIRPRQRDERTTERREHLMPSLPLPRYPGLRFGLPAARRLQAIWRSQRPDAIYVATEGPLGWAALRAARALGIASASGFHTRFDEYMRDYGVPFLGGTALRWMRHFHNLADATLVPTTELRDFLSANRFANVVRLARAVDTELFHPERRDASLRTKWGLGEQDLAVIHLGRIAAEKNLDLAIRSFREINARHPTARFVWVGDGPERARIERENPNFVFCGIQRGEALARHFASADLFLFPSLSETYGNVTLEALASGVPTVAFDYGAAIVESDDARANAVAFIGEAVKIAGDAALRGRMRAAARESVIALEPSKVAADFDRILSTLGHTRRTHERHASAA